ncbi:MAG: hypothetical protein ACI9ES_003363 [Oceanospirillaceae bacterium]|jgi:hypothetical protein
MGGVTPSHWDFQVGVSIKRRIENLKNPRVFYKKVRATPNLKAK